MSKIIAGIYRPLQHRQQHTFTRWTFGLASADLEYRAIQTYYMDQTPYIGSFYNHTARYSVAVGNQLQHLCQQNAFN